MSTDARAALADFVAALERHLEVCLGRHGEDDPRVVQAYQQVIDAFESYEDALVEATGEVTPLDVFVGDEDDDLDDDDDDLDDEDDDEDFDFDDEDDEDDDDEDVEPRR